MVSKRERSAVRWWQFLLVFGIFVVLLFLAIGLAILFLRFAGLAVTKFGALPEGVAAALITGGVTVVAAVATITLAKFFEQRSQREIAYREKRTPFYEEFVKGLLDVQDVGVPDGEAIYGDVTDFMAMVRRFTDSLIVWGSNDLIEEWGKFRLQSASGQLSTKETADQIEKLLLIVRKDLGLKKRGLKPGYILRLWLNDYDALSVTPSGAHDTSSPSADN